APVTQSASLTVDQNVAASALSDQEKCPAQDASFSTTASGSGPYNFVCNVGSTVLATGGKYTITTVGAVSTLTISGVVAADAGTYSVTAGGLCGAPVTQSASLTVDQNVAASALSDQEKCTAQDASFSTTASGTGPYNFVWNFGSTVLATGGKYTITTVGAVSTLTISGVVAADAGTYSVTAGGLCGAPVTQSASLTVDQNVAASALSDQEKCTAQDASFSTTASGTGPYNFVWNFGSTVLATGGKYTITTVGAVSTLTISGVVAADAGTYSVTAGGLCGAPVTQSASLTVDQNVAASALSDQEKCPAQDASFSTTASGTRAYNFVWNFGSTVLSTGGKYTITTVGAVSTLTISGVVAADAGTYSVTAGGLCGAPVTQSASLTVDQNVAASALSDQEKCPAQDASFSTTASGTGPYNFVWNFGSTVLATGGKYTITTVGAVSTLTISGVVAADAGTYSVTAGGLCGAPVTQSASLTVDQNVA